MKSVHPDGISQTMQVETSQMIWVSGQLGRASLSQRRVDDWRRDEQPDGVVFKNLMFFYSWASLVCFRVNRESNFSRSEGITDETLLRLDDNRAEVGDNPLTRKNGHVHLVTL